MDYGGYIGFRPVSIHISGRARWKLSGISRKDIIRFLSEVFLCNHIIYQKCVINSVFLPGRGFLFTPFC